ncbi:MAG: hypothetical protein PHY34_02565 [Patescibacteria group bacterium]|nr:hypothetical protein [Patescibacteria group bacterium]MDD5715473.1 hypothetical protein [Patescibacteria group bacterium]
MSDQRVAESGRQDLEQPEVSVLRTYGGAQLNSQGNERSGAVRSFLD